MTTLGSNELFSDKPATYPELEDRLGFAPFAKNLANAIYKMTPTDGLVLGIHGAWGTGKTTLINFIAYYIKYMRVMDQPTIVRFNPWWFSGHDDLTRRFFDQLQGVLSSDQQLWPRLKEPLADFVEIVTDSPIPCAKSLKVAKSWLRKKKDLFKLKDSISKALTLSGKRILLIMDDIDRLSKSEIKQIFGLIKSVADFPNVIYLVAFDKNVVAKSLEGIQGLSGQSYLEKIIQVPIDLPTIESGSLQTLFLEKLLIVLGANPSEFFDKTYWENVYHDGLRHLLRTPRQIAQLVNAMRMTYPLVSGEVNPVDFVAIETIRVFSPDVYEAIRINKDRFAGPTIDRSSEDLKNFCELILGNLPSLTQEPIKKILFRIFPKVESAYKEYVSYSAESEVSWQKQLRICSPRKFSTYFCLSLPRGDLSQIEKNQALSLTGDPEAFGTKLIGFAHQIRPDGTTNVRNFLDDLGYYIKEELPRDHVQSMLEAFFETGDELIREEDDARGMVDFGNDRRIARVIRQLLSHLADSERFEALQECISKGSALSIIVDVVTSLGTEHGKYTGQKPKPFKERLVNERQLVELEKASTEKIELAAKEGKLVVAPLLPLVLYRWCDWAGKDRVHGWIEKLILNDESFLSFLEKFLQRNSSINETDTFGMTKPELKPKYLSSFIDPSKVYDRILELVADFPMSRNQKLAISEFKKAYELLQEPKDSADHG